MTRVTRPKRINLGSCSLPIPIFFPSVSSVKTALKPCDYLAILYSLREVNQNLLVSAYDLAQTQSKSELEQFLMSCQEAGIVVLMDSGNYESYWKNQKENWNQADFHDVLTRFSCALVFGFDEQDPPIDKDEHVALIVRRWERDQKAAGSRVVVPIVHATTADLHEICVRVAKETLVPMIAVPERRLGSGVLDRTRSVMALRDALDGTGRYVGLHLLGTGNPISMALYAAAGADSFDGLEWCKTVADHETGLLYHFAQADFFRHQTDWVELEVSFEARTLAHNLDFYIDWIQGLRNAIQNNQAPNFCRLRFPPSVFKQCADVFGWE